MQRSRRRTWFFLFAATSLSISPALGQEAPSKQEEKVPPIVIEELEQAYRFDNTGTAEYSSRARVHIRTEEGRQSFGQLFFPFRAEREEVRLEYVRTIKAGGQIVQAAVEQPMEVTAPVAQQAPMFSDLKYKVVPVPGLEVGDRLEYKVTNPLRVPLKPGDFWLTHYPTRQFPVLSERVTLDLPADRKVILKADESVPHVVEERDGRRRYQWVLSNPEAQKGKVLQRRLFTLSSLASLSELGAWYRDLQKDRAVLTPELQHLAEKIIGEKKNPKEKLEAIYRYVAQSIRYVSISLGLGGYQSHHASETVQNLYGDCKDKHTLLQVLLLAVGLEAYPALASLGADIEPAVPSPGQFDHVISVVPLGDQWVWLDTTLELAPLGFLPRALRGKQALVIRENESRLVETPKESPVPERRSARLAGEIDAKGTLSAKLRYENRGEHEIGWRQLFRRANSEAIELALRLDRPYVFWQATTEPSTNSDPLDLSAPFTVEYKLKQHHFVNPLKRSDSVHLPGLVLQRLPWTLPDKNSEGKTEKEEEIEVGGPLELEDEIELAAQPNYKMHLPEPVGQTRDFAAYEFSYGLREGKLWARRVLRVHEARVPIARRAELESFAKLVERDRDQGIAFERVGEVDLRALAEDMTARELYDAGREALDKQDMPLARDLFEKASRKDPQHKEAWKNLGYAYERLGQFEAAQDAYEKQIEINPRDDYAHNQLGEVLLLRGRTDEAIDAFKRQIEINPSHSDAHGNLADAYLRLERWSEAEEEFKKAAAITPKDSAVHFGLGRAQLKQGKREAARASFDRAIELDGSPGIYNDVAYMLAEKSEELDLALRYAESAVIRVEAELRLLDSLKNWQRTMSLQIRLGAFLDTLGWVLFQQRKPEKAANYVSAGFELHPHPDVAQHLARLYAVLGQPEKALRYYARSLGPAPGVPERSKLPAELESYVREKLIGPDGLQRKLEEINRDLGSLLGRLEPEGGAFTWPQDAPKNNSGSVFLVCLADENGRVQEAEALTGSEPWRSAALADVKKLKFAPVSWNDRPLKTLRHVNFLYSPGGKVEARQPDVFRSIPPGTPFVTITPLDKKE